MTASRRTFIGWLAAGLFLAIVLCTPAAQAGSVKDRMAARAPEILKLKSQGLVGENNRGFLELRGAGGGQAADLVEAENKDRRMVYKAIAAKTGGSVKQVGRRAAVKRAEVAGGGEWLQNPSGEWYRK
jgi:uncharacterized protein YdbL (DUF1318 family)